MGSMIPAADPLGRGVAYVPGASGLNDPPKKRPWSRCNPDASANPATAGLVGNEFFRAAARLGGKARWASVGPAERSERMRSVALARWHPGGHQTPMQRAVREALRRLAAE